MTRTLLQFGSGWSLMGVCRYCGQKAGWFRDAHEGCEFKAREAREERLANQEVQQHVEEAEQWASMNSLRSAISLNFSRNLCLDEYGTENWDGVYKEAEKFLVRAAESDGESQATITSIKRAFAKEGIGSANRPAQELFSTVHSHGCGISLLSPQLQGTHPEF